MKAFLEISTALLRIQILHINTYHANTCQKKTHYGKIADLWRAIIKDTHKEAWETIEYKRKYKIAEKKRAPLPDPPEGDLVEPYITLRCFYNIFTKVISLKIFTNIIRQYVFLRFSD